MSGWNPADGRAPAWWALLPGDLQEDMRAAGVAQIAQDFFMHEDELGCERLDALIGSGPAATAKAECECCACDREARLRRRREQLAELRAGAA